MLEHFEPLIKLTPEEEASFGHFIKAQREKLILPSKETAKVAMQKHQSQIERLLEDKQISNAIVQLRQLSYDEFLKEEALFNSCVLSEIGSRFKAPKAMLEAASLALYDLKTTDVDVFQAQVREFFGTYAGAISPYIYQLCLSNTQSRRSRAGKVFEGIIYFLYEHYNFKYESQSSIGRKSFSDLNLGKVVDSILPSREAFEKARTKTIVGTMKTTLRERWQEVVEEISRSNLPNIHLLTVDDDISENKAVQMAQHNIVLVVLNSVKQKATLSARHSIIDFETYFLIEIPQVMSYWYKDQQ
jgi:hypothetical protein